MSRRPNVILINCDDLGYGDLGCYGSEVHDTPVVDRPAEEGCQLTDFYMGSAVCTPSRGAMLTGCYPPRIGFSSFGGVHVLFPGMKWGLNPDGITIARLLNDAGYATQMVGKWHCGDQPQFLPTRHGFDHWFGLPYSNDMGRRRTGPTEEMRAGMARVLGIGLQDGDYPPLTLMLDEDVQGAQPDQAALTERHPRESVRFMRERRDEPFFLYFAHMYVHLPIYVQPRFMEESCSGSYGAAVRCIDWALHVLFHEPDSLGLTDGHDCHLRERQRRARPRRGGKQRAAAGNEGDHLGGWSSGAVHRAVAGPRPRGDDQQRRHDGDGPLPDDRGLVRGRGAHRPDHRRARSGAAADGRKRRLTP